MTAPTASDPNAMPAEVMPSALCRLVRGARAGLHRPRDRALRAPPHFQSHEGGNGQTQKNKEEDEKDRVDRQDRGGQHGRESHHRQEQIIPGGRGAVEPHDDGEQHQVNRRQQGGVEARILRVRRQHARNDPQVEREENKIGDRQPGADAVRNFRPFAVPPAVALEQQGGRKHQDRHQVQLPGGDQGQHARQEQKIKGDFKMAPDGGEMHR